MQCLYQSLRVCILRNTKNILPLLDFQLKLVIKLKIYLAHPTEHIK